MAAALTDLIDTHYRDEVEHYRRVYDVSRVRPAGSKLRTFGGTASGPLPLARMLKEVNRILASLAFEGWRLTGLDAMEIDHAIAQCVVAGGVRTYEHHRHPRGSLPLGGLPSDASS
ncbi:hypothetical protein MOKP118_45150 [Mycobacterium avium subsp. hominissuis]